MKENITKIKYIKVFDKIYEVIDMAIPLSYVDAKETKLTISDVPESEVFDIAELSDFRIILKNYLGQIVNMTDWKEKHK